LEASECEGTWLIGNNDLTVMNRGPEKQAIDDDACDACDAREVWGRSLMISLVSNAYRIAMIKN